MKKQILNILKSIFKEEIAIYKLLQNEKKQKAIIKEVTDHVKNHPAKAAWQFGSAAAITYAIVQIFIFVDMDMKYCTIQTPNINTEGTYYQTATIWGQEITERTELMLKHSYDPKLSQTYKRECHYQPRRWYQDKTNEFKNTLKETNSTLQALWAAIKP